MYASILEKAISSNILVDTKPAIQLAEPFDGVEHSFMITPLLANKLQNQGYHVVVSCGRNSGPKLTLNTLDIYNALQANFLTPNTNTTKRDVVYGWALNQKDFFPALDAWVDRRRIISKRPFLATLEKVLNPAKADILFTSVFHIPYLQKMIELGTMAGFKAVIVLKRGLEGSLAPSLSKATGILCGVQLKDGTIKTQEFDVADEKYLAYKMEVDSNVEGLTLQENIKLIENYQLNGYSGSQEFDNRTAMAIQLYTEGLNWINEQRNLYNLF
jgi:anthranilate phosphoribosyltransferase